MPTIGQASTYSLLGYDLSGNMNTRERRYDGGLLRSYSLLWDGDNRLRQVNEGSTNRLTAAYDGGGTRVSSTVRRLVPIFTACSLSPLRRSVPPC